MKSLLVTLLCVTGLTASVQAQVLSERAARNALLGGIAGAIIGENNDHRSVEGALIGATAGLAWTALTEGGDGDRRVVYSDSSYREVRRRGDCDTRETVVISRPERPRCEEPSRVVVIERPREVRKVVIVERDRRDRCDRRGDRVVVHRPGRCGDTVVIHRDGGRRGDRVVVYRDRDGWRD